MPGVCTAASAHSPTATLCSAPAGGPQPHAHRAHPQARPIRHSLRHVHVPHPHMLLLCPAPPAPPGPHTSRVLWAGAGSRSVGDWSNTHKHTHTHTNNTNARITFTAFALAFPYYAFQHKHALQRSLATAKREWMRQVWAGEGEAAAALRLPLARAVPRRRVSLAEFAWATCMVGIALGGWVDAWVRWAGQVGWGLRWCVGAVVIASSKTREGSSSP